MRAIHLIIKEIITPFCGKIKLFRLISAIFQEHFGVLVVEKRHAISEHYFPDRNGQGWASCRFVCGQRNKTTAEKAVCKGWMPKSEGLHCCLVRDSEAVHNSVFRLWSGKLYSKAEKVLNVPRIRKKGKKKERSAKLLSILLPFTMLAPLSRCP